MILLQEPFQVANKGLSAFEKIQNPILIILLVVLITISIIVYRYFTALMKEYKATIIQKELEIQSLNRVLQEVRASDAAMIIELKNTLVRFSESDKEHNIKLENTSSLLHQLVTKIDLWIKVYNK